ncbi:MAG: GspH/FimT family pseudopilin [Gemmatimonadota bacterium]
MRPGFTLVELLVVIAIVTLASALAVPPLVAGAEKPIHTAANDLRRLLDGARSQAAVTAKPVMLTIDPARKRYWIQDDMARVIRTDTLSVPGSVTIATSSPRLRFRFTSTQFSTGDTIRLVTAGLTRMIHIDTWTGEARVE